MNLTLAYLGQSRLIDAGTSRTLTLVPNLARDAVSFAAPLRQPLRFREAISALHEVVISDQRYRPRDKSGYEAWKRDEQRRVQEFRQRAYRQACDEILRQRGLAPGLDERYQQCKQRYFKARRKYANYLLKHDPALWRALMPCDPIVTVAEDVVFFECFSVDESSYGCLTVDRADGFEKADGVQPGTTNVDYSWELFDHFQALRSYRQTRLDVDPAGFTVQTQGHADYREEKIDLPPGWLRGFMQIQEAMGLPMRRVTLSREAVYSLLAWLRRHRAKQSPRAVRFELVPDQAPRLVLEPWDKPIDSPGTIYHGPPGEPVRVWGRRRLLVLARLLPLAESFDVYLLGTGLPSFWVARLGEMRLTLGLSGWTANDWTRGSALDLIAPPAQPHASAIEQIAQYVHTHRSVTFAELEGGGFGGAPQLAAALRHLAHSGQVIYDLAAGVYRWRQVMPQAVGEAEMGPEHPELTEARKIRASGKLAISSRQEAPAGGEVIVGKAAGCSVELLIDSDGRVKRGKCVCSYYHKFGLRNGPCAHLQALRAQAVTTGPAAAEESMAQWYRRLLHGSSN